MTDDLSEYDESEFYYPDEISDTGLAQQATYFESYLLNDDKIQKIHPCKTENKYNQQN